MRKFYYLILLVLISTIAIEAQTVSGISPEEQSCDGTSAKIMILGTYHMGNPHLDGRNLEADDVLLPKRQREIAELNEKLARFNPTKIRKQKLRILVLLMFLLKIYIDNRFNPELKKAKR